VTVQAGLPELANVYWRPRASDRTLARAGRLWTLTTAAHSAPFVAAALLLAVLKPVTIPVGLVLILHAWVIPELYAARGAGVVRPRRDRSRSNPADPLSEQVALGLLGDLLDHVARDLHSRAGLVLERGRLGAWLVGATGALLVRPGGRRVHCYCVKVSEPGLPPSDQTAHLLLALREDESGFATVANLAFAGAPWRLRRRLPGAAREALEVAVVVARGALEVGVAGVGGPELTPQRCA
jgi:hypothetical protein